MGIFARSVLVELLLNCCTVAAPQTQVPPCAASLPRPAYESSFWAPEELHETSPNPLAAASCWRKQRGWVGVGRNVSGRANRCATRGGPSTFICRNSAANFIAVSPPASPEWRHDRKELFLVEAKKVQFVGCADLLRADDMSRVLDLWSIFVKCGNIEKVQRNVVLKLFRVSDIYLTHWERLQKLSLPVRLCIQGGSK